MKYLLFILTLFCFGSLQSQCLKANVSILLDWSSSEDGVEGKLAYSAFNFANSLNLDDDGVKVSITRFNDDYDSTTLNYLTFVNLTSDINNINVGISNLLMFHPDGGTTIADAIDESIRQITSDGRTDAYKVIIIISDGEISDYLQSTAKIFNYRREIPLSIWGIQIVANQQLPTAPLTQPSQQLFPVDEADGFEILSILTGNTNRVFKSSITQVVETLKKLDICL